MLVELLLQFLVGVVNAELFKGVLLEVFKPVDIKDTNERTLLCGRYSSRIA